MILIKETLNKIKGDKRENPNDYSIVFWDNVIEEVREFPFTAIKEISENFVLLELCGCGEEREIPLPEIKMVKKKGEIIWKRSISND